MNILEQAEPMPYKALEYVWNSATPFKRAESIYCHLDPILAESERMNTALRYQHKMFRDLDISIQVVLFNAMMEDMGSDQRALQDMHDLE